MEQGQLLEKVDFKSIKDEGYDPTVMVIVTNTNNYKNVTFVSEGNVSVKQLILTAK